MSVSPRTLNLLFSTGYIAKGIVYVLVGGLTVATLVGFGQGSGIEGPSGVLEWVNRQAFGNVLVGALGVGLLAYALWRIYRGAADPLDEADGKEGAVKRVGYVVSGLANGALAFLAIRLALDSGGGSSGDTKKGVIAELLQTSYGPWVVGLLGAIVIGVGLYQFRKGIKADFVDVLTRARHLSAPTAKRIGRYGLFARGVVFGIIGYFLILAATQSNADSFKGTEGALEYLASNPYGLWLLGVTATGLLLYGTFAVLKGYYGRIVDQG